MCPRNRYHLSNALPGDNVFCRMEINREDIYMCKHLFVALRYLPIGEYLASLLYDCRKFRNTLFLITIILYYYADETTYAQNLNPH